MPLPEVHFPPDKNPNTNRKNSCHLLILLDSSRNTISSSFIFAYKFYLSEVITASRGIYRGHMTQISSALRLLSENINALTPFLSFWLKIWLITGNQWCRTGLFWNRLSIKSYNNQHSVFWSRTLCNFPYKSYLLYLFSSYFSWAICRTKSNLPICSCRDSFETFLPIASAQEKVSDSENLFHRCWTGHSLMKKTRPKKFRALISPTDSPQRNLNGTQMELQFIRLAIWKQHWSHLVWLRPHLRVMEVKWSSSTEPWKNWFKPWAMLPLE